MVTGFKFFYFVLVILSKRPLDKFFLDNYRGTVNDKYI